MTLLSPRARNRRPAAARRGAALLLVLVALAIGVTLSLGFLQSQSVSLAIGRNTQPQAQAKALAEAGLDLVARYIADTETWRDDQSSGVWLTNHALGVGTLTISVTDDDGDLTDDIADPVTVTVAASVSGVTHRLRAALQPAVESGGGNLLFVVPNDSSLSTTAQAQRTAFEGWGYTVTVIDVGVSDTALTDAADAADVVYITEDISSSSINTRLNGTTTGVVTDEPYLADDWELYTTNGGTTTSTTTRVVDNSHSITDGLSLGSLTISGSGASLGTYTPADLASGTQVLTETSGGDAQLVVADAGAALHSGTAAGRRVLLHLGGDGVDFDDLNANGLLLVERSLEWASQPVSLGSVTALTNWSTGSTHSLVAGDDRALVLAISLSDDTGNSPTSVTYGGRPMTHAAGVIVVGGWCNRVDLYYLTEAELAAASGSSFSVNWSVGGPVDVQLASRLFGDVDQDDPLVGSATAQQTNANQLTAPPIVAAAGDWAVAAVSNGSSSASHTWFNGFDEALDTAASTSSMSAADYPAPGGGAIAASCQPTGSNRFVLAAMVLRAAVDEPEQPGVQPAPQLVALYEFNPTVTYPTLVGHWTMNSTRNRGLLAATDEITATGNTLINSFNSSDGPYNAGTAGGDATLHTESLDPGQIILSGSAVVRGDAYVMPGGNPATAVTINDSAQHVGNTRDLGYSWDTTNVGTPSGFGGSWGNYTLAAGSHTIDGNYHFDNVTIDDGANITVSGDRALRISGTLTINGGSIDVPPGNNLAIYAGNHVYINNDSQVGIDTDGPSRLQIYQYSDTHHIWLSDTSQFVGLILGGRDIHIEDDAHFYGNATARDDIRLYTNAQAHLDATAATAWGLTETDQITGQPASGVAVNSNTGRIDNAIEFDGSGDYLVIPHHSSYELDAGTVSFWFYADDTTDRQGLVSKDAGGMTSGGHLNIELDGSSLVARLQDTGTNYTITSSTAITAGRWYHVGLTFGPGGMNLLLDGVSVGTDAWTGGLGTTGGGSGNTEPILVGAGATFSNVGSVDGMDAYFNGRIDELRLYDSQLTTAQIADLANADEPGGAAGVTVIDSSGSGLDLTISDPDHVSWSADGLLISDDVTISSGTPATALYTALTATDEFTVEVDFTPVTGGGGTDRIISYASTTASGERHFALAQTGSEYDARARTADTGLNGMPSLASSGAALGSDRQRVLMTYNGTDLAVYRNSSASPEGSISRTGDFSNWDSSYVLALANRAAGGDAWHGTLHRVAIYDRGVNSIQADQIFNDQAPTATGTDNVEMSITWLDQP